MFPTCKMPDHSAWFMLIVFSNTLLGRSLTGGWVRMQSSLWVRPEHVSCFGLWVLQTCCKVHLHEVARQVQAFISALGDQIQCLCQLSDCGKHFPREAGTAGWGGWVRAEGRENEIGDGGEMEGLVQKGGCIWPRPYPISCPQLGQSSLGWFFARDFCWHRSK